jgi:hypothetical protein
MCAPVCLSCSNEQISAIVGLRIKGVAKRVAEKKMRLDLRDSAVKYAPNSAAATGLQCCARSMHPGVGFQACVCEDTAWIHAVVGPQFSAAWLKHACCCD